MTGHGGGYRVYRPEERKIYISSFNHTTAAQDLFPWYSRPEFAQIREHLPVDIFPTAEALVDDEELGKYEFEDHQIEEVVLQLQSEFKFGEPVELATIFDATPEPEDALLQVSIDDLDLLDGALGEDRSNDFFPEQRSSGADSPPPLERVHVPDASIVYGDPPPPVRRSLRQNNPPPLPPAEKRQPAPPRERKQESKGYIDGVRGTTMQDGEECLIVHWWDCGEDENTIMTRTHAASLGVNMRSLISDYDEHQANLSPEESALPPLQQEISSRQLSGQLNLLHLNVEGGCPVQM
jgi:hypothetical protein